MVEMRVDSVQVTSGNQQKIVVLKDLNSDRYLFIWIAQAEGNAIMQGLRGDTMQRPLTHDLLKSVIQQLGAKIDSVTITELRQSIYHASINLDINGKKVDIDSRSSDAIALAVRVKCPIYAAESVMDEAAIIPEEASGKSSSSKKKGSSADVSDIFKDFINTLEIIDDIDKNDR